MFFAPGIHHHGIGSALCWLALSAEIAIGARLRVRHVHGRASTSEIGVASQMSLENDIKDSLDHKPLHHLKRKLMKKMQHMNVHEIMNKMGNRMPSEVVSLVKSSQQVGQNSSQPFSEKSIAKARRILNGMVEEAQGRLDVKDISCKEFYSRNRLAWTAARADQARLGEQITDLIRLIGDSNQGIQRVNDEIQGLEEDRDRQTKEFEDMKAADETEMISRKDDLAVAEFILSFTICSDKKPPTMLLQPQPKTSDHASSSLSTLTCEGTKEGELEFHFEDPKLERQAQRFLTPGARQKLRMYLGEGHAEKMHHDLMKQQDAVAVDSTHDAEDDEADSTKQHHHHSAAHHKKDRAVALAQVLEGPPVEGPPAVPGASKTQSRKCVLGKPNCGLLHDNMSLMWGKFKDLVDTLQAKMDRDAQNFADLKADINEQISTLTTAKATYQTQMNEAISDKSADVEEQRGKGAEERLLQKEFKEVQKECKATIYEILYTDICGVLTVRGEISKFSKEVPPDKIQDCEFGDLEPGPCSITCDDNCSPHNMMNCVGGTTLLTREVVQQKNKYGHKCPKLQYTSKCGQVRCPVNCGMSSWSSWGKCTKECEGGAQIRSRNIVVKPKNGGDKCDATGESRVCNTFSCDRDCTLKKWTHWSPCSQMCDNGSQVRFRHVHTPVRGNGKCPGKKNPMRFEERKCNTHSCVGDELCIAKMDFIVAIDGSGSLRESGYDVLKEFAAKVVRRFQGEKYGSGAAKVGVVQFGNGMILKDRTISAAKLIQGLDSDTEKVAEQIEKTVWEKGFTNLAQAFATAETISMNTGRSDVPTTMMVISDGKPSFKFETWQKAKEAKAKGMRIVMVILNDSLGKEDRKFMKELASGPDNSNIVMIPGMKTLKSDMETWVIRTLVQSCPRSESPSAMEMFEESAGFEKVMEGKWCGEDKELHQYIGFAHNERMCNSLAVEMEATHFSFSTASGDDMNKGHCYMEMSSDGDKCPEGWVDAAVNYYKVTGVSMK